MAETTGEKVKPNRAERGGNRGVVRHRERDEVGKRVRRRDHPVLERQAQHREACVERAKRASFGADRAGHGSYQPLAIPVRDNLNERSVGVKRPDEQLGAGQGGRFLMRVAGPLGDDALVAVAVGVSQ